MARRAEPSARVDRAVRIVVVGVGVALALTACAVDPDAQEPVAAGSASAYPTPAAAGASTAPNAEPPGRDDHDHDVVDAPPPPAAQAAPVAAGFAAAWARSDLPAARWWPAVADYCDEDFARSLRTVDPALVPASRVTGRPRATQTPRDARAVFEVPTDAGTLTVRLAGVGGRWRVTDNDFRRAASR
ncbi:hypothetical protein [Micromonospora sediminicola]|uniref:hypothetical protein n=1 Tax=Micromonospora sediminicola TaxID=946078 RepID=UPI0037887756